MLSRRWGSKGKGLPIHFKSIVNFAWRRTLLIFTWLASFMEEERVPGLGTVVLAAAGKRCKLASGRRSPLAPPRRAERLRHATGAVLPPKEPKCNLLAPAGNSENGANVLSWHSARNMQRRDFMLFSPSL